MATAVEPKRIRVLTRKLVPLKRLKEAPHNPPGRTTLHNIRALIDSMDMLGLLHPITVTIDYEIIDGHRRLAAAKALRWRDIECTVVEEDPASVYASVNVTSRKMSGAEMLAVWLKNPKAVPARKATAFSDMQIVLGPELVKRIAAAGYSDTVFRLGRRIANYCEDNHVDTVQSIVTWLLDVGSIGQVKKAIENGESPKTIIKAVRQNKPVKFRLQIED